MLKKILLLGLCILFLTPIVTALTGFEYLANNTIVYYNMSGATDSLNRLNISGANSVTQTGKINDCQYFPGTGYNTHNPLGYVGKNRSVSAWIRLNGTAQYSAVHILRSGSNFSNPFMIYNTPGDLRNMMTSNTSDARSDTGVDLVNGVWYFIVSTYDGVNITTYVNGSYKHSYASALYTNFPDGIWKIGQDDCCGATSRRYKGDVDELAYFNKTLNQTEIDFLYNGGSPGSSQQYPFTNSSGVTDSCSYTSGNWTINVKDNCNITTTVNLGRNVLTINGSTTASDRLYITGSIKNYSSVNWLGINTTVWGVIG